MRSLSICLTICAVLNSGQGVITKVDFDDDSSAINSTKAEDDDVEVKHTIVVSTKLKNNNGNRRGLHGNDEDTGIASYNIGRKENPNKDDSDEVPVVLGYKGVETTHIRTPDTRFKPKAPVYPESIIPETSFQSQTYPESIFISRNIRDDYDIFPNVATNSLQWKPSNHFNNINYWNPDHGRESNFARRVDRPHQNQGKNHRKLSDDGIKDFYCRRCREMTGNKGCGIGQISQAINPRSWVETTTAKMKIDGKLAKLN